MKLDAFPPVVRRLGPATPKCISLLKCPDVLELADGSFAVIGAEATAASAGRLPEGVGCGPGEALVLVPREVMLAACAAVSATAASRA